MRALPFVLMLAALLPACSGGDSKAERREQRREARQERRDGDGTRSERGGSGGVERFDANKDGTITREEFTGRPRRFERLDRNGDGKLTGDEF